MHLKVGDAHYRCLNIARIFLPFSLSQISNPRDGQYNERRQLSAIDLQSAADGNKDCMASINKIELIEGNVAFLSESLFSLPLLKGIEFFGKVLRAFDERSFNKSASNCLVYSCVNGSTHYSISFLENGVELKCDSSTFIFGDEELIASKNNIISFLNRYFAKGAIDFSQIDFKYFEQILGIDVPFIVDASIEMVRLSQLKCFDINHSDGIPLEEGRYYKQLIDNQFVNEPNHVNNYYLESNEERFRRVLAWVKADNYRESGKMITVYNDSFIIRDGEHRATALLFLNGDSSIPILRIAFSHNYYSYRLFYEGGASR